MQLTCPLPNETLQEKVLLSMGGGGRHMARLLSDVFFKHFDNEHAQRRHDSAVFRAPGKKVAFTCDGHVVRPMFFPGGNIGSLCIHGTVNDLACAGARPRYLSAGFILEEGLSIDELDRVCASMRRAADEVGAQIVTGDTKVVERGKGDGIFITVTGLGDVIAPKPVGPERIREEDVILVSGDIGRHGIAIMAKREGLSFETELKSDSAAVWPTVEALIRGGIDLHCLRDLTRGGLGAALIELAQTRNLTFEVEESAIPVDPAVAGACEILGLEPLFVACEGRFAAIVSKEQQEEALEIMGPDASCIGSIVAGEGCLIAKGALGNKRTVILPSGEQLPRIC
ncbi:MAG: hydrogenase expression/formation protein HypE [Acidobacteriota bacterium]|nr:hydrogenase expression/formation protein HypE [Acidobacteriota bacterium]